MRKIIIHTVLLVVIALSSVAAVSAQHYIGVRGGYGNGSARFYPKKENRSYWGMYNGGVVWKYFTAEKIAGGVEVDLLFMQQGFKYEQKNGFESHGVPAGDTTGYYARRVNSIMMPMSWHPHVYLFRQKLRVFANAGITISYNISQRYEYGSRIVGKTEDGKYDMNLVKDNRWGYGLMAGGGAGWAIGRWEVFAEFRYYIGYADIMKNKSKYALAEHRRSPLDGMQISAGLTYRLGKGGILQKPSDQTLAKWAARDQKRAAKKNPDTLTDSPQPVPGN